jgi:hypothetical protein
MVVSRDLPSSTVMTPSLPTLSIASAIIWPICWSWLAELAPTWATSLELSIFLLMRESSSTIASTAAWMPRWICVALAPLATFFRPLGEDRLGVDGRGGGAVAGDGGGLRSDLLHHLRAHVLVRILELDLLGDGDAVLGDGRRAEGFLEHDVAAGRAERDLDGAGEFLHAAKDGLAGLLVECNSFSSHWFAPDSNSDFTAEAQRTQRKENSFCFSSAPSAPLRCK